MDKIELRVANLDFTSTDDHELVVEGIVNDGNWSQTLGVRRKFKEKIAKGAFTRAIKRALEQNGKIDFLAEHDPSKVLSSTVNDSLTLWEDETKGLCMRASICPTSWGKDTFQLIKSGIIKSMSFGFNVIEDEWINTRSDVANRIVKDLHLIEVSAVRNPAYLSSAISARGMELVQDVEIGGENNGEMQDREEEKVTVQEEVQAPAENSNKSVKNETVNNEEFQHIMDKVFEQFEKILSNYIKPQENTEVTETEPTEQNVVQEVQEVQEQTKEEQPTQEPVTEQPIQDEKVEETSEKSQIDYAIEILSKYKKIQELQK